MEPFVWATLFLVYLSVGYVLTAKWVWEEHDYPMQDRSNAIGQVVALFIWPLIIVWRAW